MHKPKHNYYNKNEDNSLNTQNDERKTILYDKVKSNKNIKNNDLAMLSF